MLSIDYFFSKEIVADKVGFELGYFSIFDDDKILYDGKKNQNFMLFLSIPDILLDLCDLIESKKKKKDTVLADSSVIMSFLNKDGKIQLRINDIFIFEEKSREVIKVFYDSSKEFVEKNMYRIEDSVKFDLKYGLKKYQLVMANNNLYYI